MGRICLPTEAGIWAVQKRSMPDMVKIKDESMKGFDSGMLLWLIQLMRL